MAARPQLVTRNLAGVAPSREINSPAEQRKGAHRFAMLNVRWPLDHHWVAYFVPKHTGGSDSAQLGEPIATMGRVSQFFIYSNNVPVAQMKMGTSMYLFKLGFWEDHRNITGGCWTFRVPYAHGPIVWEIVQLLAVGEELQRALAEGDTICGVSLAVEPKEHVVTVWNRYANKVATTNSIPDQVVKELSEQHGRVKTESNEELSKLHESLQKYSYEELSELQEYLKNYSYVTHAGSKNHKLPVKPRMPADTQKNDSPSDSSPAVTTSANAPRVAIHSPE